MFLHEQMQLNIFKVNNFLNLIGVIQNGLNESLERFTEIEKNISNLYEKVNDFEDKYIPIFRSDLNEEKSDFQEKSLREIFLENLSTMSDSVVSNYSFSKDHFLKKKRLSKQITDCPHTKAKHYAKNMCSNCYHTKGRNKAPWKCQHKNRMHYALGLCQNCYHVNYMKRKMFLREVS